MSDTEDDDILSGLVDLTAVDLAELAELSGSDTALACSLRRLLDATVRPGEMTAGFSSSI